MKYTVQKGDFNLIQDGIEINRTTPRPYVGMPVEIDDEPADNAENQKPVCCSAFEGCAPAMAYVPWQAWEKTYEPEEGLINGTLFPCLNLPFLGGRCK